MRRLTLIVWLVCLPSLAMAQAPAEPEIVIGGLVLTGEKPLAGASVALYPAWLEAEGKATGSLDVPRVSSTTDEQGRFGLTAPEAGFWRVHVEHDEFAPREIELLPLLASRELPAVTMARGAAKTQKTSTRALESGRRITGRVIEEGNRKPVAGALVWSAASDRVSQAAWRAVPQQRFATQFTRTDAEGRYELPVASGPDIFIMAVARGYALDAAPLGQDGPTLVLAPVAEVSGHVADAKGQALADVRVVIVRRMGPQNFRERRREATTDAFTRSDTRGRFRLSGLLAGSGYELRFSRAGLASVRREIEPLQAREEKKMKVVLTSGRSLVGKVLDVEGEPIAGATVRGLESDDTAQAIAFETLSDAAGRVEAAALASGRYRVEIEAAGFAPRALRGVQVPATSGQEEEDTAIDLGTVMLQPGARLAGRVVTADQRPLPEIAIHIAPASGVPVAYRDPEETGEHRATSDSQGQFEVPDLSAGGRYDLLAIGDGYSNGWLRDRTPPEDDLEIVLVASGALQGRIVGLGGTALEGAKVEAWPDGPEGQYGTPTTTVSSASGEFYLAGLPAGLVTMAASARGYLRQERSSLEISPGETTSVKTVELELGATITGTVRQADGEPLHGALVQAQELVSGRIDVMTTSDGDGRFELEGVGLGPRSLVAWRGGRQTKLQVDVAPGEQSVELRFAGGVEVSGRVVDARGDGVAGASVTLSRNAAHWAGGPSTTSDSHGDFVLEDIEPGPYGLAVHKDGLKSATRDDLVVGELALLGIEIRLDTGVTLHGRILGLSPEELARVEVRAQYQPGEVDREGRFEIENLAPGEAEVVAALPGAGRQAQERIHIEEGVSRVEVDVVFADGWSLTGSARFAGKDLVGATVFVSGLSTRHEVNSATDEEGAFRLVGLPTDMYAFRLVVAQTGLIYQREVEVEADEEIFVDLVGQRITGRVLDTATLGPLEGARVNIEAAEDGGEAGIRFATSVVSDAEGRFNLGDVPEGQWRVVARRTGYADRLQRVAVPNPSSSEELEILLPAATRLTFEVATDTGAEPAVVLVGIVDDSGRRVAGGFYEPIEGSVSLTTVPAGDWQLVVAAEGFAVARLDVTVPSDAGRILLRAGGQLHVTVADLVEDDTLASMRLFDLENQAFWNVTCCRGEIAVEYRLAAGRVSVGNVPPGRWQIQVRAQDGREWIHPVDVVAGDNRVALP